MMGLAIVTAALFTLLSRQELAWSAPTFTPQMRARIHATVTQHLLLIGGGKRPAAALERWLSHVRGKVLVIAWASEVPEESFADWKMDLTRAGANAADLIPALRIPRADQPEELALFLRLLREAGGVLFTGGNQAFILDALAAEPQLRLALSEAFWLRGIPFAGTSAGTAIMSSYAIRGGENMRVQAGLGFLPGTVVDQHFLERGRLPRLYEALKSAPPGFAGVGIEEDCAGFFEYAPGAKAFQMQVYGDRPQALVLLKPMARNSEDGRTRYREEFLRAGDSAEIPLIEKIPSDHAVKPALRTGT